MSDGPRHLASGQHPPAPRRPTRLSYEIRVVGVRRTLFGDLYHLFLRISWPAALTGIVLFVLLVNAAFAAVYAVVGGVAHMEPGSFVDAFSFSVQTLATIGYGAMYPESDAANALVWVESVLGLLTTALSTGLVFAKFSQPHGRIVVSRHAVITTHDGRPTLMFRVGNERGNRVVNATVSMDATLRVTTAEGRRFYKTVELTPVRARIPALTRSFTVMHVLDGTSPLAGLTPERVERDELEIVVTVTGLDDTTGQTTHGQHTYEGDQLRFGHTLVDILSDLDNGGLLVDISKFHEVEPERPGG